MTVFKALRPDQWIKNIILFAALIFAGQLQNRTSFLLSIFAFVAFCLVSSAVYLLNDIIDRENDQLHPQKKLRPIASGRLSVKFASMIIFVLLVLCLVVSIRLPAGFGLIIVAYFLLNVAYSLKLKKIVIIDVLTISIGFVLRAYAGGIAIDVPVSQWLVLCTMLLALFLAVSKRRHELILLGNNSTHRASLMEYSIPFLDQIIAIVTTSTLVLYIFYCLSPEVKAKLGVSHLELSIPFVIYGIFRYLYLIYQKGEGGDPTQSYYNDLSLLISVLLWAVTVVLLIYL